MSSYTRCSLSLTTDARPLHRTCNIHGNAQPSNRSPSSSAPGIGVALAPGLRRSMSMTPAHTYSSTTRTCTCTSRIQWRASACDPVQRVVLGRPRRPGFVSGGIAAPPVLARGRVPPIRARLLWSFVHDGSRPLRHRGPEQHAAHHAHSQPAAGPPAKPPEAPLRDCVSHRRALLAGPWNRHHFVNRLADESLRTPRERLAGGLVETIARLALLRQPLGGKVRGARHSGAGHPAFVAKAAVALVCARVLAVPAVENCLAAAERARAGRQRTGARALSGVEKEGRHDES
mmetsp:Transcript_1646/g.4758  ORF Transcript_1646/g.4758 Transcript_1646/m.4758 type:complete len:288 (+) Transcript_1646:54-917(+)